MFAYLVSLGLLVGLFWVVEHVFGNKRGRPWWRPQVWTDLFSGVVNALLSNPLNFVVIVFLGVVVLVPTGIIPFETLKAGQYRGFGPIAKLPRWPQFAFAFVLGDFLLYWIHRWFHGRTLWRFHAVHHSSEKLDWLSGVRAHPVNDVFANALLVFPFILLGFDPVAAASAGPLLGIFALLGHADVDWDWGPLRLVVVSPAYHRWHHSKAPEAIDKNFASFLPLWDILFGTLYLPRDRKPEDFGIHEPVTHTVAGLLRHPFRASSAGFGQNPEPPPLPATPPERKSAGRET